MWTNPFEFIDRHSRDELGEQAATLSDHTCRTRFFLLRTREVQTVVHFSFLVQDRLFLLYFTHALFLRLVRLREN